MHVLDLVNDRIRLATGNAIHVCDAQLVEAGLIKRPVEGPALRGLRLGDIAAPLEPAYRID